ncbi:MAG: hypothetical protein H6807_15535 [Planctomycetes bacterium]|nr:hypothetical protein [Planctomycetota bacterium]
MLVALLNLGLIASFQVEARAQTYPCGWAYWNNLPSNEPQAPFPEPPYPCSATGNDFFRLITGPQVSQCCQSLAFTNVPDYLPDLAMPVEIATFDACTLSQQTTVDLEFRSFVPQFFNLYACNQHRVFRMYLKYNGNVFMAIEPVESYMRYTRTFFLPGAPGESDVQVWRYVINGDADFDRQFAPPFWVPPCHACPATTDRFERVHFVGHADFSCKTDSQGLHHWDASISLSHHVGCLSHLDNPFINPLRKITAPNPNRHESTSYHMVGPLPFSFLAAPPMPQDVVITNGGIKFDAVRSTVMYPSPWNPSIRAHPFPPHCLTESSLYTVMEPKPVNCMCEASPPAPAIYYHSWIRPASQSYCYMPGTPPIATGQSWQSVVGASADIPDGFVQLYLGHWGAAGPWSNEGLLTNIGLIDHLNHCFPDPAYAFHITHGVTTTHDRTVGLPHFYDDPTVSSDVLIDFVDQVRDMTHARHAGMDFLPISAGSCVSTLVWTISKE